MSVVADDSEPWPGAVAVAAASAGIMKDQEATTKTTQQGYEATAFQPGTASVSGDEYVKHDDDDDDDADKRKKYVFCGCCCESTRTAVVVANIVSLCFYVSVLLSYCPFSLRDSWKTNDYEILGLGVAHLIVCIIFNALGIYGAFHLNKMAIAVVGWWQFCQFFHFIGLWGVPGVILAALFAYFSVYPHYRFYWELHSNNQETPYPHDCCC